MEIRPIISALCRSKTAPVLLILQIAVSFAILTNALDLIGQRHAAASRGSGVLREADVFSVTINRLRPMEPAQLLDQQRAEMRQLLATPGVASAATVNQLPLGQGGSMIDVAAAAGAAQPSVQIASYISADSLVKTLELQLVSGRDFVAADVVEQGAEDGKINAQTVILTQALANRLFGADVDAVGKSIYLGARAGGLPTRVIGVVARLQTPAAELGVEGELSAIFPVRAPARETVYVVRAAAGQRDVVMGQVDPALRRLSAVPEVINLRSMEQDRDARYRGSRTFSWMLAAVVAMLFTITGGSILGMTTLWLNQRRTQIGIRRALGATRFHILRYFLTENVLITTAGIVLGLCGAVGVNLFLVWEYGWTRLPLVHLLAGSVVLWLLGLAAAWLPARRASAISPATATRAI